ncbi:MAG: HYR domain-containing protein [Anaerolineales bacterium]|nr:HYR domain-containing protein [Anaerolineales bacterium]
MKTKTQLTTWSIFFIFVLCLSLVNVNTVLADDGLPPTDQPVATEETPEVVPPIEEALATEEPAITEETIPVEETVVAELLTELPENVDVVVMDEEGEVIPLSTQEALNVISDTDPMWCPAGVLPGGAGCTINFATIALLLTDMRNNTLTYDQHGIIYFTATPGASFALTTAGASLGSGDFNTLNDFNLTLQGGWNGLNGASATFVTQTNFGTNSLTIGSSSNPWVGNLTLNNFLFNGVTSSNAISIFTTSGDVTFNNVDVNNQGGTNYTAFIDSDSGDITIQNGSSFDGNNTGNNQNRGFSAATNTGAINITNTTFNDARGCFALFGSCLIDELTNYSGATLSAPTVNLSNVTANNNDLSGIRINNASLITLNNVTATNNGTLIVGSGVYVNGTGSTIVNVTGGTFSNNEPYGIYLTGISAVNYLSPPTCSGNLLPLAFIDPNNCDNIADTTPPVLTLPANITVEAAGASGAVVTFSASANDAVDGVRPVTCSPASGSTFSITTTTVTCSASDNSSNTSSGTFTVSVQDTTAPLIAAHADITQEATSSTGNVITYTNPSTSDAVAGAGTASCLPASGSTFPIGNTTVTCNAIDSYGNAAIPTTFVVHITDTTPPTIAAHADIFTDTTNSLGAFVSYVAPATFDTVDGAGVAICNPPSGSKFPIGKNIVTCTAIDSHGNSSVPVTFIIQVDEDIASAATTNGFFIPATGGSSVKLNCVAPASFKINMAGARIIFNNLCEYEAFINNLQQPELPNELPSGFTLVDGYTINISKDGNLVNPLPEGSSVAIEFNVPNDQKNSDFGVLYWNGTKWSEIAGVMLGSGQFMAEITAEIASSNTFIFVTK